MPQNPLPFRRARRVSRWWRAPVVASPELEGAQGRPRIYVCELGTRADARIICASLEAAGIPAPRWLAGIHGGGDPEEVRAAFLAGEPVAVPLAPATSGADPLARLLAWAQKADVEVDVVPVEALWGPEATRPRLRELWLGDPFAPPRGLRWLHVRRSGRCRVLAAAPTTRSELESHAPPSLAAFARSKAVRALARQAAEIFGEKLKTARFLAAEILAEPGFQDRIAAAGAVSGLTREQALGRAALALRELARGPRRLGLALFPRLARRLRRFAFDPDPSIDGAQLARLRELGRHATLVFLPSRQSLLDLPVVLETLFEAGIAAPFTALDGELASWPVRWLFAGTGAFRIRDSGDDPVDREVLRAFVEGIIRRRFHLGGFLEAAPTRTGKLQPARFDLLRPVVEASSGPDAGEVWLIPASLTYDVIPAAGGRADARTWLRPRRRARRPGTGRIHLRFGEPLPLRETLAQHGADRLALERLGFAICNRIDASRPLLPSALVCALLLEGERRALTGPELEAEVEAVSAYARERGIELGAELGLGAAEAVGAALDALCTAGTLQSYAGGIEPVFFVPDAQRPVAAYARNSLLHWFLGRAIAQLAVSAAKLGGASAPDWALRMRELLAFEFFFSERDAFLSELEREQSILESERERGALPFAVGSPRILADLLGGYWAVAEMLAARRPQEGGESEPLAETELLERCQGLARQLELQGRIDRSEALSATVAADALQLLAHLGAIVPGPEGVRIGDGLELESIASDLERLTALARLG